MRRTVGDRIELDIGALLERRRADEPGWPGKSDYREKSQLG